MGIAAAIPCAEKVHAPRIASKKTTLVNSSKKRRSEKGSLLSFPSDGIRPRRRGKKILGSASSTRAFSSAGISSPTSASLSGRRRILLSIPGRVGIPGSDPWSHQAVEAAHLRNKGIDRAGDSTVKFIQERGPTAQESPQKRHSIRNQEIQRKNTAEKCEREVQEVLPKMRQR